MQRICGGGGFRLPRNAHHFWPLPYAGINQIRFQGLSGN